MPARLVAYVPDSPASTFWLEDGESADIGRGREADIALDHRSVSRQHAHLRAQNGGWYLQDADSKNGSFVDGSRIESIELGDQHWFRLGDVHCEFRRCPHSERELAQAQQAHRQAQSTAFGERLQAAQSQPDVLQQTLQAIVALAECERGFMLVEDEGGLRVLESCGADDAGRLFAGSRAAIERALRAGEPVVVNDTLHDRELAARASVVSGGIRSVLALPLLQDQPPATVIYADRRGAAQPITRFDLDLVLAFAERASVWIAARRSLESLRQLPLLDADSPPAAA